MTIKEAIILFEKLKNSTDKKSELKLYTNFIFLLSDLGNKKLTDYQFGLIEAELENLNNSSNLENKKKYYKKQFEAFKKFLKEEFSFITQGYYTAIGMSLGMCFGVALGTSVFNGSGSSGAGLAVGMAIGMAIGSQLDSKAKKEGKVLKVNLS